MYDTYRFKDKDPVIDIVRTCIDIYAATANKSLAEAISSLSKASGVSKDCMYRWFRGATRYPRFCTVIAVVHATGRQVTVGDKNMGVMTSTSRFRVVKGGRVA